MNSCRNRDDVLFNFMFRTTLSLLFLLITHLSATAQIKSFGKGVVNIVAYGYRPGEIAPDYIIAKENSRFFDSYTYYINEDQILRNDRFGNDYSTTKNREAGVTASVTFTRFHPIYWIDWTSKKHTCLSYGRTFIGTIDLGEDTYEIFFRCVGKYDSTRIFELRDDRPVMIGGKKSFMGKMLVKSDTITFFYTRENPGVYSPLNSYLPSDFPYFITSLKATTKWSTGEKAYLIFEVEETAPLPQNYTYKAIPDSLPVRKLKNIMELLSDAEAKH